MTVGRIGLRPLINESYTVPTPIIVVTIVATRRFASAAKVDIRTVGGVGP